MMDSSYYLAPPSLSEKASNAVQRFLSSSSDGRRYLFGRNQYSAALVQTIAVEGFVDDYAQTGSGWCGKPVVRGEELPRDAIVVNCVLCTHPLSAVIRLAGLDIDQYIMLSDLLWSYPSRFSLPEFVRESRQDVSENWSKWQELRESLKDDESKRVCDDVTRFRCTASCATMERYSVRAEAQYFEPFLELGRGEVFVDAGGFDGDTTEEFCKRCPDYSKVLFFEPSQCNIKKARVRLRAIRNVEFIEKGLSDRTETVAFDAQAGSASAVKESGHDQITMTTLDDEIQDTVSFVKMDLEGWELKALRGASRHIVDESPKLAIAVYHHSSDFRLVFDFVTRLRDNYCVYLRHYTEGWSETIMFFVPSSE